MYFFKRKSTKKHIYSANTSTSQNLEVQCAPRGARRVGGVMFSYSLIMILHIARPLAMRFYALYFGLA